ncbi:MAG: hypothetical protein ACI9W6_000861, partial [Motiliproteus sp.]
HSDGAIAASSLARDCLITNTAPDYMHAIKRPVVSQHLTGT